MPRSARAQHAAGRNDLAQLCDADARIMGVPHCHRVCRDRPMSAIALVTAENAAIFPAGTVAARFEQLRQQLDRDQERKHGPVNAERNGHRHQASDHFAFAVATHRQYLTGAPSCTARRVRRAIGSTPESRQPGRVSRSSLTLSTRQLPRRRISLAQSPPAAGPAIIAVVAPYSTRSAPASTPAQGCNWVGAGQSGKNRQVGALIRTLSVAVRKGRPSGTLAYGQMADRTGNSHDR